MTSRPKSRNSGRMPGRAVSPFQSAAANASLEAGALRLLKGLSAQGAYASPDSLDDGGALNVFSSPKGVSLRSGRASAGDAREIVAHGLAEWTGGEVSGRQRLTLTDAGRAHLLRAMARPGTDPFLAQHRRLEPRDVEVAGVTRTVTVDRDENPLAWLATRKSADGSSLLHPDQLEAGERLRRDLTLAQMLPRVTANWDISLANADRSGAPMTYSDAVIAARQRAENALRSVGPEFAGLLMDVCGFLKGLELVETERRWPRRSAKLVLALALSALARHYGIEAQAQGPARSGHVRHWGAGDYRPVINPPEPGE